ncbi:MAG: hypothetical protein L0H94_01285 [Nitrospira sp.]|nr:hypothetical protein [Nitrospira sp.]
MTVYALGNEQYRFLLEHEGTLSETRRPRLNRISEQILLANNQTKERTLRVFAYADRDPQFSAPNLVDLGALGTYPASLVGAISRPIRRPAIFNNPNGIFQLGEDQIDDNAPTTHSTTEQWGWLDINGDGLLDFQWGREKGHGVNWGTFETNGSPGNRPPQQLIRISEGIVEGKFVATDLQVSTHSLPTDPTTLGDHLEKLYAPSTPALRGHSAWIWGEGRGMARTGLPTSVSGPEIRKVAPQCPPAFGQDSRLWPVLPDGTFGGSQASIGDSIANANPFNLERYTVTVPELASALRDAYHPSHSISSTLSSWLDLNGDGVPEFIASPGWIERFELSCIGRARTPQPPKDARGMVDRDWHISSVKDSPNGSSLLAPLRRFKGPKGPVGLPLDFQISTGSPEGFGFTLPIGSLASAGVASLATWNPAPLAMAIPGLITQSFSPRSYTGTATYAGSPSITGVLEGLGMVVAGQGNIGDFISSNFKINYDLTLLSTTSRNRSETRAQLMDINADGLPDYVMYNSGTLLPGIPSGSLVTSFNSPEGFSDPVEINKGFDYRTSLPDLDALQDVIAKANVTAAALEITASLCKTPITPTNGPVVIVSCTGFAAGLLSMAANADEAVAAASAFMSSTTDAIPAERFHVDEARALASYLKTAVGVSLLTLATYQFQVDLHLEAARAANTSIRMLERTVRQLGYRSRLNIIARGFSELDGSLIGQPAQGIAVQTRGFIDLNGDALPDYVVTSDREKTCPDGKWEVFWGRGSSSMTEGTAFLLPATCMEVPVPPDDVKARGFLTLPLNVDRILRLPTSNQQIVDTLSHSYVSLMDFNNDGRPDIVMAGEGTDVWNPDATSRTWSIFLNTGNGFEATASRRIASPQTNRSDIRPVSNIVMGLNVPYPAVRTTHTDASLTSVRDRTDTQAALLDINGDGTSEMAIRVTFTAATGTEHDGLLVWRRSSTGPQDYLIEDRYPIEGQRILIEYKPASYFQWEQATPNGQPPQYGHHALAGISGPLVRSVTTERLMGREEQRTRLGYEYRSPYFDSEKRWPAGFAVRNTEVLDSGTGAPVQASVMTAQRNAQRSDGVHSLTHQIQTIRGTGAPVYETLISPVDHPTTSEISREIRAIFSGPTRRLSVEYPEGLTAGAIFNVGFDGRDPFLDRATNRRLVSTTLPAVFPLAATGGAAGFNTATVTALQYLSPHIPNAATSQPVPAATIETWIRPAGGIVDGTVVQQPGAYRLAVAQANGQDRVQLDVAGSRLLSTDKLTPGRWTHVVATFGSGNAKLFFNGVEVGSGAIAGSLIANGDLVIGCSQNRAVLAECYGGAIGELRIYPEVWPYGPRVTDTETEYQLDDTKEDFGQPIRVMERHDLANSADDVFT